MDGTARPPGLLKQRSADAFAPEVDPGRSKTLLINTQLSSHANSSTVLSPVRGGNNPLASVVPQLYSTPVNQS